jgi:hypothetical protein
MEPELNLRHPSPIGDSLFLVTAPVHLFLPQNASIALAAVTLCPIGGAWFGFGARSDNLRTMAMELLVACLFGLAALAGLLRHWTEIPFGLAKPAVQDLLYPKPAFGARVPRWYIPLCVIYDLAAALFLVAIYAT